MITYKIIHHIPGRIRIEVPAIKKFSIKKLMNMSDSFLSVSIPDGIKDIRPNPFSGSIVITYEPSKINIIEYIETMASNTEMLKLIGGRD